MTPRRAPSPCATPGCPRLTEKGTRCEPCRLAKQQHYDRQRGTATQRGYDSKWAKRSRQQRQKQPWCSYCASTEDLTADHIRPGDPNSPLQTLCRACNTKRANRMKRRAGTGKNRVG